MKQALLRLLLISVFAVLPALVSLAPAYAAPPPCGNSSAAQQVAGGIDETASSNDASCGENGINSAIHLVVNILSIVVGALSVIVIILSGFKYITSGGDSGRVGNAKNTLIYALVGVAIAALAQLMIHFVLAQSNNITLPDCSTHPALSPPACK